MPTIPITLPVAEWAPDLPAFQEGASVNVRNVVPRTPLSYGPLSSPAPYSSALNKRCQGAYAALDSAGNVYAFAGDANDLYQLSPGSASWVAKSKSAGAYSCTADQRWSMTLFGPRVIASDFTDPIQALMIGAGGNFADLAASAPKARYVAAVKSWLVAANTYDPTNGAETQRVWWSANNDPTNWPTPGTASAAQFQSDYVDLLGDGGLIQGIVGNLGTADGAVFMERAIWRMVYAGPPATFDFAPAEGVRGTPAPSSIVQLGSLVYYLGEDGFYAFDGTASQPIGVNKVDKTFFADLDQSNMHRIVGAVDPINKLVFWAYPGQGNSGGNPNHLLIYNWALARWSIADVGCEWLVRALSFGYTLDQLYTVLGYTLDNLPFALDSRVWTGGNVLLGLFDSAHKLNFFTGTALAPTVDTAEVQPFPGQRTFWRNARPLVDGGTPLVAIGKRERVTDAVAYAPPVAMGALGTCPQKGSARYVRAEVTLPAGAAFTHIQGVELEATPAGWR
jgi:hypothetical protein